MARRGSRKGRVLITGGAGFIGSHTADELDRKGYGVRILDSLSPKTHYGKWPEWVCPEYEKVLGDVRDGEALKKALMGVDYVIHLAAQMDLMPEYSVFFDTNVTPTAALYEIIAAERLPIRKVIVASSQFVYGEGRWKCARDGGVFPRMRTSQQMGREQWDPVCPECGGVIEPLKSAEWHQDPPNQYAISKYAQEMITLKLGRQNDIPSVAMRYSIVHGPRQSLRNAYSGALRVFTLEMLSGKPLTIFEDGKQLRDYVSVHDVARANVLVLENPKADFENFNVGSGQGMTVVELAKVVAKALGVKDVEFKPNGEFRVGDIRHAVSDITKLKRIGWRVKESEEKIVGEYVKWVREQKLDRDYASVALEELRKSGVVRKSGKKR